jgi:hypothetical protein
LLQREQYALDSSGKIRYSDNGQTRWLGRAYIPRVFEYLTIWKIKGKENFFGEKVIEVRMY